MKLNFPLKTKTQKFLKILHHVLKDYKVFGQKERENLIEKLKESFLEQKKNDQIEECLKNEIDSHYLPWHYVYHPQKMKMRIVFAANCKTKEEKVSLNDLIYRGPVLLPELC